MNQLIDIDSDTPKLPMVAAGDQYRIEIDIQISTAHAYPRQLTTVIRNINSLATMSEDVAKGCIYTLPRDGKSIVGPSIRLAEILFSQWGNCTGGSRITEVNREEGWVEAEGVFHDLQTNARTVRRTRRGIKKSNGRIYSDDMILVTGNAAGAIAFRNAVFSGVPRSVWDAPYRSAMSLIRGDIKSLPERRMEAIKAFSAFGMKPEEVYTVLGVAGDKDITIDHLVTMAGIMNAIKEGETDREQLLEAAGSTEARRIERKSGDITSKPKNEARAEPEQKPAPKTEETRAAPADETKHDPETGEVTEETGPDEATVQATMAAVEKWMPIANTIKGDLVDANVDEVLDLYAAQIKGMESEAPEIHAELMAEVKAYREAQA